MEITTKLALFLANKPGTLAAVCDALAAERINIFGLTISDTVDHAVVRMVVSDCQSSRWASEGEFRAAFAAPSGRPA